MEIIIYRHAEPRVSNNEIISGHDFPLWVQRYNDSGICINEFAGEKEEAVYTSDLARSLETGRLIGKNVIPDPLFREAEIPLIKFPAIRFKAKLWLFISRSLWLLGLKTKCESLREARQRARKIVERIDLQLLKDERIVIIGHGFLSILIKKELLHKGWLLGPAIGENGFLNRMSFKTKPVNTADKQGQGR
jgi:broad specificity phosphatase PhoE